MLEKKAACLSLSTQRYNALLGRDVSDEDKRDLEKLKVPNCKDHQFVMISGNSCNVTALFLNELFRINDEDRVRQYFEHVLCQALAETVAGLKAVLETYKAPVHGSKKPINNLKQWAKIHTPALDTYISNLTFLVKFANSNPGFKDRLSKGQAGIEAAQLSQEVRAFVSDSVYNEYLSQYDDRLSPPFSFLFPKLGAALASLANLLNSSR